MFCEMITKCVLKFNYLTKFCIPNEMESILAQKHDKILIYNKLKQ